MATEYLAMYLELQFAMGRFDNPVIPIRHFASSRSRLGDAVRSGDFFTNMDDAIREIELIRMGMNQISVLFDSTLPGRGNILKGQALKEFREMNLELMRRVVDASKAPTIRGPRVDGFSLFFGMKTARMPYPAKGIDVVSWRRHFTQPGRFIGGGGASFMQNMAAFGNNVFSALTLTDLPVTHWTAGFP